MTIASRLVASYATSVLLHDDNRLSPRRVIRHVSTVARWQSPLELYHQSSHQDCCTMTIASRLVVSYTASTAPIFSCRSTITHQYLALGTSPIAAA
eukprot:542066-Rhodomonas_salina.3